MSRFLQDIGNKVEARAGEVRQVVESGRDAAAAKGNELMNTVAGKGGEVVDAGIKGGEAIAGAVASGADITQQAQQIVARAVRDVEAAGSRAGQTIEAAAVRAAGDAQSVAATANREINDVATRARNDITKLLDLIGGQLKDALGSLPDGSIGTVNGEKFYTPVDCYILVLKAVNDRKPSIEIKAHEPEIVRALGFMVARNAEEFKRKMEEQLRTTLRLPNEDISKLLTKSLQTQSHVQPAAALPAAAAAGAVGDALVITAIFAGVAAVLTASAVPILATGASIALILLVLAIIYAISEGYDVENVELSVGADGRPTLKFSLKKN
ncbi:MAG TPA: hypothetical protein VK422_12300 [Pyrinomonadaceae bacterium]|nr:hypothetical protein [Pyrinomonadaceae bacterium]